MNKLLVIGAGGHAKVVIDIAFRRGGWEIVGLLDDAAPVGRIVAGCAVLGTTAEFRRIAAPGTQILVAIGANGARERIQEQLQAEGWRAATLIHPAATVAESTSIGDGSVVMAGAVINPDTVVGKGVIVNTGAVVDHDCVLEDYCHIAPGVAMCGGVTIGRRALVGVGAAIIPGVAVGCDAVIGAGAAVVRQVEDRTKVIGVPAREPRERP